MNLVLCCITGNLRVHSRFLSDYYVGNQMVVRRPEGTKMYLSRLVGSKVIILDKGRLLKLK